MWNISVAAKSVLVGDKPFGGWSGWKGTSSFAGGHVKSQIEKAAIEKKRKAQKKGTKDAKKRQKVEKPAAKMKTSQKAASAKKKTASLASSAKEENVAIWTGPPDDVLEGGWPPGWIKKKIGRKSGGRRDPYWFSPITQKKLRSLPEVKRFMDALQKSNGDEDEAWAIFKGKK